MEDSAPSVDLQFLREFCRNDKKKMQQYIHTFLESTPRVIQQLKDAAAREDWTQVKILAHTLKPQAGFIGLPRMKRLLEEVEDEVREGKGEEKLKEQISHLDTEMNAVSDALVESLINLI